ncbi:glycosyltransferase [Tupanvirus soda lake]|uniref:Glycosyltransferase n=2 Tax=Tupanvirus TaxID=2094720 RepID=A0A6N1NWU7_9VIRU|nr:glycosyltransferase [Tupanvirus soda lake]QKU35786.1 glycosyltransferase [Tupanvirus soda lake]
MPIPKILHQIWLQGEKQIPYKFIPNINKVKQFHLTWKYILWDDLAIIQLLRKNDIWIQTYYKLTYLHQKIDYAKYIILYEYGGVYVDVDVIMVKPFDTLLDNNKSVELVVSKTNLGWFESMIYCGRELCINNGIIMAQPKSPILNSVIDYVNNHTSCSGYFTKFGCINKTTGPVMFTHILLDHNTSHIITPTSFAKQPACPLWSNNAGIGITILDPEYLEPKTLGTGDITENTYCIHEHEGSWLNQSFKQIVGFYIKHRIILWLIVFVILISIYLILINQRKNI